MISNERKRQFQKQLDILKSRMDRLRQAPSDSILAHTHYLENLFYSLAQWVGSVLESVEKDGAIQKWLKEYDELLPEVGNYKKAVRAGESVVEALQKVNDHEKDDGLVDTFKRLAQYHPGKQSPCLHAIGPALDPNMPLHEYFYSPGLKWFQFIDYDAAKHLKASATALRFRVEFARLKDELEFKLSEKASQRLTRIATMCVFCREYLPSDEGASKYMPEYVPSDEKTYGFDYVAHVLNEAGQFLEDMTGTVEATQRYYRMYVNGKLAEDLIGEAEVQRHVDRAIKGNQVFWDCREDNPVLYLNRKKVVRKKDPEPRHKDALIALINAYPKAARPSDNDNELTWQKSFTDLRRFMSKEYHALIPIQKGKTSDEKSGYRLEFTARAVRFAVLLPDNVLGKF